MQQPHCFASCSTCNLHSVGSWVAHAGPPPYRLNYSLWAMMGLSGPPASSAQHYGQCDDRAERLGTRRDLYEWKTERCDLPRWDRERACAVFRGQQVVVAGDSTAGQLFLSLVLLLGGSFGRNSRHTSTISDLTAVACDDAVRLNFVRNDLLLWSTHRSEFNRARECDRLLKADGFVQRVARDAHTLVLATGHHFPASMEAAASAGAGTPTGFFSSSLNHTLTELMRARARWGHEPSSVAVMGLTLPVPGCSRFTQPLSAAGWLAAEAKLATANKYSPRWRQVPRLNELARWLATAHGARFVDVGAPSARWPSGMMASHTRGAGSVDEDCLHSCLPGPVDTYNRLLVESLLARSELPPIPPPPPPSQQQQQQQPAAAGAASAAAPAAPSRLGVASSSGATAASSSSESSSSSNGRRDGGRFFRVAAGSWLHERNAGAQFESCGGSRGACVNAHCSAQAWWPFGDCMRRRTLAFCQSADATAAECVGGVRKGSLFRLCDTQGANCRNMTLAMLRQAAAHGLLR